MIRVAAVGDIHIGVDSAGTYAPCLEHLAEQADLFLIAGDLTRFGTVEEGTVVAKELAAAGVPTIAVLGNHDHHAGEEKAFAEALEESGIRVLEGNAEVVEIRGVRVGVAGTKGFGGGFADACATDFGEAETKAFVRHTEGLAARLEASLTAMEADVKIALMHYSPVEGTLRGERLEIYPFLGSYLLGEAVDRAGADLVLHGHAHGGVEKGMTSGGVHVRNVAQAVIRHAYHVYCIGDGDDPALEGVAPRSAAGGGAR